MWTSSRIPESINDHWLGINYYVSYCVEKSLPAWDLKCDL